MKKNAKSQERPFDWSKFENVPFAVVAHSAQVGWQTISEPNTPSRAWQIFEALDAKAKMLLNYGMTVASTKGAQ